MTISMSTPAANIASLAFRFALIIGIANLFADMTYEGARSITGPFLGSLGANGMMVGLNVISTRASAAIKSWVQRILEQMHCLGSGGFWTKGSGSVALRAAGSPESTLAS